MVMYLASLKSVPEELYEAARVDGATWWQRMRYVTLPMMRNVMGITALYSLIPTFAGFTIVSMLTGGGPLEATQVLGTSAFYTGILGGNLPMGSAIAMSMEPILAVAVAFILRGISKRGNEA